MDFCLGVCRNFSKDVFSDAAVPIFANTSNFPGEDPKKSVNVVTPLDLPQFYVDTQVTLSKCMSIGQHQFVIFTFCTFSQRHEVNTHNLKELKF